MQNALVRDCQAKRKPCQAHVHGPPSFRQRTPDFSIHPTSPYPKSQKVPSTITIPCASIYHTRHDDLGFPDWAQAIPELLLLLHRHSHRHSTHRQLPSCSFRSIRGRRCQLFPWWCRLPRPVTTSSARRPESTNSRLHIS